VSTATSTTTVTANTRATGGPPAGGDSTTTEAPSTGAGSSPLARAQEYLAGQQGRTTVALFDAQSGQTWTINAGMVEDTASIVKLEIMGALLSRDQIIGQSLSATDSSLLTSMIENSDNDSATALWDEVGGASGVAEFDQQLSLSQTVPSSEGYIPGTDLPGWGLTTTSALDQVTMVKALVFQNSVLDPASQQVALHLMENVESDQDWGVTGGVPAGVTVALKNGWLPLSGQGWQVNSVGWVDGDDRNYVLAVLSTDDPTEQYGIDTIQTISADVYDALGA
jgi:Beta-lactamase enzyme family